MPQSRIPLEPGLMYHVWTHANGSENLFRSEENYDYFLKKYTHHVHPVAETFAYCLMPNHLHLMIRVREEDELLDVLKNKEGVRNADLTGFENLSGLVSKQFSNLFNAYTKAFNKRYERRGALFERAFKRKLIDSDEYFVRLIVYIHNNPVHHGFVVKPDDWLYSSWQAYLLEKRTNINKTEGLSWFGGKGKGNEAFINLHRELKPETMILQFEE